MCSSATGRPLGGVRVTADLLAASCAEGHQPWRCGDGAVTDAAGHYGLALYDAGSYRMAVSRGGRQQAVRVVRADTGVTTVDWTLAEGSP